MGDRAVMNEAKHAILAVAIKLVLVCVAAIVINFFLHRFIL